MKKIKENKRKDLGVQEFTCMVCGSIFDTNEYSFWRVNKPSGKSSWVKGGHEFIPSLQITVKCPVCEIDTHKYIPTGEPSFWGSWELM